MRLPLDNEWLVDCDEASCQLIRLVMITGESTRGRQAKPENIGKMREEGNGFFGTLDQALMGYLYKRAQGSTATTATELLANIRQSEHSIRDFLRAAQVTRKDLAGAQP